MATTTSTMEALAHLEEVTILEEMAVVVTHLEHLATMDQDLDLVVALATLPLEEAAVDLPL
jgi:hypothetical protein